MTRNELMERLGALNSKAKSGSKPIYFNDEEYAIIEKAYIALDLNKDIFAKIVFADTRAIIDNEAKWDFMIAAHDSYIAKLQYQRDIARMSEIKAEMKDLEKRKELFERNNRCYIA